MAITYLDDYSTRLRLMLQSSSVRPTCEAKVNNPYYDINSIPSKKTLAKNKKDDSDLESLHYYNASYDIWKIKLKEEDNHWMKTKYCNKEINFLIRYKIDSFEFSNSKLTRVVILPKLEYQLELGASVATKQELVREWTSLFFRPFSHLYRIRTHANTSEVVSIESVNLQKVNYEAMQSYEYKPCDRLNAVYHVFTELIKHEPGNYLLHHIEKYGPFVQLLKENKKGSLRRAKNGEKIYDLHAEYSNDACEPVATKKEWCPINVNYVLPIHLTYKRLPGTFQPCPKMFMDKKVMKKKNKAQRKAVKRRLKNCSKLVIEFNA